MAGVKRVLLVQPIAGARWRSITAYASSVALMLRGRGISVDVIEAPWFNPPSLFAGVRARWWRAEEVAHAGSYDVVHITDQALAHHVYRFRKETTVVVTCHDLMPFATPGYYASRAEGVLKRAFLRRPTKSLLHADLIVAVSSFTGAQVRERLDIGPERIRVVPNVVRPPFVPRSRGDAEAALEAVGIVLPPGRRVISIGNDRAYKNLDALLEAMAQPVLSDATLIRVGQALNTRQRARATRHGVLPRTVELSALSDDHLALIYAAGDVLAQPSIAEGFGIPVIEAMACGLPVVVSDGGSLPEVVQGAARVVALREPDFVGAFAQALGEAAASGAEVRRAGLERAARFGPEAVVSQLLAAYETAMAGKR